VNDCFLISYVPDGGYNMVGPQKITMRRTGAIGDALCSTIVANRLAELGHPVVFQAHGLCHPVLKHCPNLSRIEPATGFTDVNLDGCYENHPFRKTTHFHEMFMSAAGTQLARRGIVLGPALNCRPRLRISEPERQGMGQRLSGYAKPWVFIVPRSDYYVPRQVPDEIWQKAAEKIMGTVFWLGRNDAPAGALVDLKCRTIESVMAYLAVADLLITVDTGPMHIAAAMGIPILAIGQSSSPELHLGDQVDFFTIGPAALDCLNCQQNACPINKEKPPCHAVEPDLIAAWANVRLLSKTSEDVSCVIPIYRPSAEMLNRCLEAVLPQVSEVVITRERAAIVPHGIISDPKIRHVMKPTEKIGFGRNVNFGFRHTHGKYVLVLNDDVYLAADAVARLLDVMKPGVGVVGHLTRYPDGTIYHAGKPRQPGSGIGFPHIDLRKREATIKQPVEMENTNGASIIFRREAFYAADGYDEAFQFYAEDDDICMKIRKAGWQVWYTPHATGIHDEHQETKKVNGINRIMMESNARFGRKWGEYFRHNATNPGLGNFGYLKKNGTLLVH